MDNKIPMRPVAPSKSLNQKEQDCLTWYVLKQCTKEEAFRTFVNPAMQASSPTLKRAADQFFATKEAISYISAYKDALNEMMGVQPKTRTASSAITGSEDIKRKKADALRKLTDYVLTQANNIEFAEEPDEIMKFADKLGLFDVEQIAEESPRRYLPESCSNCEYKKFIETNCKISE